MPRVFIPTALRSVTGGLAQLDVPGSTVRAVIDEVERRHPGFASGICQGERLRPGLAVTVDGAIATLGLLQSVSAGSEIHFLPAIGGG